MSKWLDKLGLSEDLSLKYYVRPDDFIDAFKKNIDPYYGNNFSDVSYIFGINKVAYRGKVKGNTFIIRKKQSFLDPTSSVALISGTIQSEKNGTRILVSICSFTSVMKVGAACLFAFYLFGVFYIPFSGLIEKHGLIPYLFLIGHAFIMFSIFYVILRRSVSKVASNLDPDFKIMIRDLDELDPKQS